MKYILPLLAAACLTACSLDEENPSAMSTQDEWTTAAGYEKKINDCYYDFIRIVYGQAEDTYFMCAEAGTDIWQDATVGGGNGGWSQILRYAGFGSSTGMLSEGYSGFYGTLSACNGAIAYADKVQGLTEQQRDELVAEAHFIRAHALFNIVENFGGKYLPLAPVTSPVTSLTCSTVNEFYGAIIADCEFATQHLPVKARIQGTVTRAAAYHLLAKACLTYSTYTDQMSNVVPLSASESKAMLEKANTAADYLINNGASMGVRLYDDVREVFADENNKTNAEALFVVTHSSVTALNPRGNYFNRVWKHANAFAQNQAGIYLEGVEYSYNTTANGCKVPILPKGNCYMCPSKYMLDLYGKKDLRYDAFFNDTYYANKPNDATGKAYSWTAADAKHYGLAETRVGNAAYNIALGDTAIYISREKKTQAERDACRYAIYNIDDNYADPANPQRFFPSLTKLASFSMLGGKPNKPYTWNDCIIYRLGETYLLSAEIKWRLGDNSGAAQRVNAVRNRACEGHDHSMDVTAADITEDFLLDEDARELIGEWQRFMTLKRFRALPRRIKKCNPQITDVPEHLYLRPVPDAEILLIENASEYQNPGY